MRYLNDSVGREILFVGLVQLFLVVKSGHACYCFV